MTTSTITVDQFVAAPPARVWRGLTEPEQLAKWWAPGDIADTVGHRFHLQMPGWGAIPCEVLEADEPELFVYTFGDWTLTWRLVAEGRGTRLLLEHSGFDLNQPWGEQAFKGAEFGWAKMLKQLSVVLAGPAVDRS